jgi:hypothetical protein
VTSHGSRQDWDADDGMLALAEINDSPLLLAADRDFQIDRHHGRQMIPLVKS